MKTKTLILFAILLSCCLTLFSQTKKRTPKIRANFGYTIFNTEDEGAYVETYLSVDGTSVQFKENEPQKFTATVEVTYIFYKDTTPVKYSKINLISPTVKDSTEFGMFFMNQQRIVLPKGNYRLDITLADKNADPIIPPTKAVEVFEIDFPYNKICYSGLEWVDHYQETKEPKDVSRGGYDLYPYFGNFFPENKNDLNFFYEVYNTESLEGKDQYVLLVDYIQVFETDKPIEQLRQARRVKTAYNVTQFGSFDVSKLPSGNYILVNEVRNKANEVIADNRTFFQKSNPNLTIDEHLLANIDLESSFIKGIQEDTLTRFIDYLYPIATPVEKNFIYNKLATADYPLKQRFFVNFWKDRNAMRPDLAWQAYYNNVMIVNKEFGTPFKKGYMTDRGRVYLQYGAPNSIDDRKYDTAGDELWGKVPYQIWHYYKLDNKQANKKFLFYNPHLSTQDYELLHSDALGEPHDPTWYTKLSRQSTIDDYRNPIDYQIINDFNNPR